MLIFKGLHFEAQQHWTRTLQFVRGYNPAGLGELRPWFLVLLLHSPVGDASVRKHRCVPAASALAATQPALGLHDGWVTNLPVFGAAGAALRLNSNPQPLETASTPFPPGCPWPVLPPSKENGLSAAVWLVLLQSFVCPS